MDTDPSSDAIDPAPVPGAAPEGPGDPGTSRSARVEAVRRAMDQALQATAGAPASTRARAQDLADELGSVVTRVRGALEDLSAAGTSQAGVLADEVQQVVGRLGRTLDDVRPATGDDLRRLDERLARIEARLDRIEGEEGRGAGPSATP
ncbi:hypothetical protein [Patulibacter sp.]|uniref:hypothetical protein n=1 Tax=Patulibacter sp. TaxID=1912859 RepID=UPI002715B014|nr:hypothetical protein [Patulibacter sp.]MDO9410712.1 hypothetical protein [Patulibacter sp.]